MPCFHLRWQDQRDRFRPSFAAKILHFAVRHDRYGYMGDWRLGTLTVINLLTIFASRIPTQTAPWHALGQLLSSWRLSLGLRRAAAGKYQSMSSYSSLAARAPRSPGIPHVHDLGPGSRRRVYLPSVVPQIARPSHPGNLALASTRLRSSGRYDVPTWLTASLAA